MSDDGGNGNAAADGIDFASFWSDLRNNMDVTSTALLNMWTEFTRAGSISIFISDQRIFSFTGDDLYISADIIAPNSSELWNVQLWAGPTTEDESGMVFAPVYETPLSNPDFAGNLFTASYPDYTDGSGSVAQDGAWLTAVYGGGGGGESESSGGSWGTGWDYGWGGGWSGFGESYNSYGLLTDDNVY